MKILIGSTALSQYIDIGREPKDRDYFTNKESRLNSIEKPNIECFTHENLIKWFGNVNRVATLDELYTIKISHIFWNLKGSNWNKHAIDIMRMRQAGARFEAELYDILYPIWEQIHGKKQANLNASPEDFFKATIKRVYDHDSIHASVAYYDKPLFNKILRDGHAVAVDRDKFENMSLEDKYKLVREEVYATALERQIIPSDYKYSPRSAYNWALFKTITSFSKGWFPLFIARNLNELWSPDINYIRKHKENNNKLIKLGA